MRALVFALGLALALSACELDATIQPTGLLTSAQLQAAAPSLSLTAQHESGRVFILRAVASSPAGEALTLAWTATAGELSSTSAPAIRWRAPEAATTASVSVTVTTASGAQRTATQRFSVTAEGTATATGTAEVSSARAVLPGSGQFAIPSPVPSGARPSPLIVGASAAPQPFASDDPGASPTPPAEQPFAQPTPTPAPTPAPSVTPHPDATATPNPNVSAPPTLSWIRVSQSVSSARLNDVFALDESGGARHVWAVGESSTALRSTDGGRTWVSRSTGIPAGVSLRSVAFADTSTGFVAGSDNTIMRTTDGGANWESILPDGTTTATEAMAVVMHNARFVEVAFSEGTLLRSENADTGAAASVTWTQMSTAGASHLGAGVRADAADTSRATFLADTQAFELDADGSPSWSSRFTAVNPLTALSQPAGNLIWAGDDAGLVYRLSAGTLTSFTTLKDTPSLDLSPLAPVRAVAFTSSVNGWILAGSSMYSTRDSGATWDRVSLGTTDLLAIRISPENDGATPTFCGWAVGEGGAIYRYGQSGSGGGMDETWWDSVALN